MAIRRWHPAFRGCAPPQVSHVFGLTKLLAILYRPHRRFPSLSELANRVWGEPRLPARILVVDDNPIVRKTVRAFLDWHGFKVCGEAADGPEALRALRRSKPEIVLLDINMPGMNGIQTAAEILAKSPRVKIIFLSVHNTPGTIHAARTWARTFVPKSAMGTALIPALNNVVTAAR